MELALMHPDAVIIRPQTVQGWFHLDGAQLQGGEVSFVLRSEKGDKI